MQGTFLTLVAAGWAAACGVPSAVAERFLTETEAQKVCFPEATQFEFRSMTLTPRQIKTIEKAAGAKVRHKTIRFWLAKQGTNLVGVLLADQVIGKHEWIDYAAAIAPDGQVRQVEILEYREHYGQAVQDETWRRQFKGKTARDRLKLNDDIRNITGATLSCRHVTDGVRRLLATYELVVRAAVLDGAGANPSGGK